ncbi:response regulator mcs4 [Diplogelasinospora grovesii]|uniref:Response regulator mcs4 n=1 Tax=Diplogelasinospora grovesii TaxID=303347 RepID=A0AAN6NDV2_9PEZI|nr:response regulator mcs4 [Diplogelasinospora grovesii]
MGDLKAKLRARFSRRNSGVPSTGSSSDGVTNGTRRPLSFENVDVSFTDAGPDADSSAGALQLRRDCGEKHGATARQATPPKSETGPGAKKVAPGKSATDEEDVVVLFQSEDGNTGTKLTVNAAAAAAANPSNSAIAGPAPARGSMQQSQSQAGPSDASGNDPHAVTSRLSSIDEHAASTDPSTDAPPPPPAADSAPRTSSESSSSSAAADPLRRIQLVDPPIGPGIGLSATVPTSPNSAAAAAAAAAATAATAATATTTSTANANLNSVATLHASSSPSRPSNLPRRQSLLPSRQTTLIRTLLSAAHADDLDPATVEQLLPISANMVTRKIWVRRPGGSATLVTINEEDLVDDVRELILRKYGNSLGRQFDAPDLTLRIAPREQQRQERVLGPEEPMARTLDAYYPGGQTVDESLIIDVPLRRTPRDSPRSGPPHAQNLGTTVYYDEARPSELGTDYFGPGAVAHGPATVAVTASAAAQGNAPSHPHTINILSTGQLPTIPQIPSPGGTRSRPYRERPERPRLGRQHTSSPTILNVVGGGGAGSHAARQGIPAPPPPLPSPSAQDTAAGPRAGTPPPRVASPRPLAGSSRPRKKKTATSTATPTSDHPALPAGMLKGGVPRINILIVEDNIINLRLLEAFVKRLKVRWQTAMNGREAVNKWRTGGFHLVLMDIQLPVMSGLDATREIRRLERMNSIGAFSSPRPGSSDGSGPEVTNGQTPEADKLPNMELFKSPVIIVALTASSLQSDRHDALAAGCNDFLTKPVTYVWLERKVMEWGCMQALIDYDGWRQWKDFAQFTQKTDDGEKAKAKRNRTSSAASDAQ